jgi:transposase-like protein
MPRRCKICDSPRRLEIDRALIRGQTAIAKIAREFSVQESNLYRHSKKCLVNVLALAEQAQGIARGRDLKAELLKLSRRAERLCDEAERKGQLNAAISAIRELSRLVALEGQFFPQATRGRISVEAVQSLVSDFNCRASQELPEDVVEIEAVPISDDESES